MTVITLQDILSELGMSPSRAATGKGARNERELLRYNAHIGVITKPADGKWVWDAKDDELPTIKNIMRQYKNDGIRAPSGYRKLPPVTKRARARSLNDHDVADGEMRNQGDDNEIKPKPKQKKPRTDQVSQPLTTDNDSSHVKQEENDETGVSTLQKMSQPQTIEHGSIHVKQEDSGGKVLTLQEEAASETKDDQGDVNNSSIKHEDAIKQYEAIKQEFIHE